MYEYKYYIETDNEVQPVYDLEFTVKYKKVEDEIEVLSEVITEIKDLEGNVVDVDRCTKDSLWFNYSKPWDELEAELWSDWDDKQIFD